MKLEVSGVSKSYGPELRVLTNVSLGIEAGQICGIVGENGSGKSTLGAVIAGLTKADNGSVSLKEGQWSHNLLEDRGLVAYIPQDPHAVPGFDAVSNAFLGEELTKGFFIDSFREKELFDVWQSALVKVRRTELAVWDERQDLHRLAILRAFVRDRPVMVVDEATAPLDEIDRRRFLGVLRRYANEGRIVLFISHCLSEIENTCDCAYALTNGRAWRIEPKLEIQKLRESVFGRERQLSDFVPRGHVAPGKELLRIEGLRCSETMPINGCLMLHAGEIICIFGQARHGQDELFRALTLKSTNGSSYRVFLGDENIDAKDVLWRRQHGVRIIPPSRLQQGLVPDMSALENMILGLGMGRWWRAPVSRRRSEQSIQSIFAEFRIGKPLTTMVRELSGGNQQKLLVAKELAPVGDRELIVVAYNPCVGIDLEARRIVYKKLQEVADEGGAVLLITSDVEDAESIGGRTLVLRDGKFVGELRNLPGSVPDRQYLLKLIIS